MTTSLARKIVTRVPRYAVKAVWKCTPPQTRLRLQIHSDGLSRNCQWIRSFGRSTRHPDAIFGWLARQESLCQLTACRFAPVRAGGYFRREGKKPAKWQAGWPRGLIASVNGPQSPLPSPSRPIPSKSVAPEGSILVAPNHSYRSATTGSTSVARPAGK